MNDNDNNSNNNDDNNGDVDNDDRFALRKTGSKKKIEIWLRKNLLLLIQLNPYYMITLLNPLQLFPLVDRKLED
mgnify:CR=1 FL=1